MQLAIFAPQMVDSYRKQRNFPTRSAIGALVGITEIGGGVGGRANEGRLPMLTCELQVLVVKSEFRRPSGFHIDPTALRRCRILCFLVRLAMHVDRCHGCG